MALDSSVPRRGRAVSEASMVRSSLRSLNPDGSARWPSDDVVLGSTQLALGSSLIASQRTDDELRSKHAITATDGTIECATDEVSGLPASWSLGSAPDPLQTWLDQASTAPPPTDQHLFPSCSTTPEIPGAHDTNPAPAPLRHTKSPPYHPSNPKKDRRGSGTFSRVIAASNAHKHTTLARSVPFPLPISRPNAAIALSVHDVHECQLSPGYGSPTGSHQSSLQSEERRQPRDTSCVDDHHSQTPQIHPVRARNDAHSPGLTTIARKPLEYTSDPDPTLHMPHVQVPIKTWAEWMEHMQWASYILPCIVTGMLAIKLVVGLWGCCCSDFQNDYPGRSTYAPAIFWLGKFATRIPSLAHYMAPCTNGSRTVWAVLVQLGMIMCDLLLYVPAIVYWCYARRLVVRPEESSPSTPTTSAVSTFYDGPLQRNGVLKGTSIASILTQPALILLDQRHLQCSCIMLGLSTSTFALLHSFLPNPPPLALNSSTSGRQAYRIYRSYRTESTRWISYQYIGATIAFSLALMVEPDSVLLYAPG